MVHMNSMLSFSSDELRFDDQFLNSQTYPAGSSVKVFNDPIHGHFELPPTVLSVVDTPHVQRLRDLKQLGAAYFVFPGASHNRFEHSLGVSYLSGHFLTSLYNNSRDPHAHNHYENERHFKTALSLLELTGLVHDLGHGPFSHVFDHDFLPAVLQQNGEYLQSPRGGMEREPLNFMDHEDRSVALFEHCVDTYQLDFEREHIHLIGDLIRGFRRRNSSLAPPFLFQFVANAQTAIDTDKFDYIARDVYNVGLQGAYGFDHRRLMRFAKIVGDDVCFHRKELFNVYHLFLTRFQLHRTVYQHRAATAIDAMLTDAFIHANSTLRIADSASRPEDFLHLSDSMVSIIERSKDVSLKQARHVIHRLRRRQLYRFADEQLLPTDRSPDIQPVDVTTCQDAARAGVTLTPDDVHVKTVTLNFGMKEQNPVDNVLFFKNWDDADPRCISSNNASYVMPKQFQEKITRVYVKREAEGDDRDRLRQAVSLAFRNFLRRSKLDDSSSSKSQRKRLR